MVAFAFLSQNFGRYRGPTNGTLPFYECRLDSFLNVSQNSLNLVTKKFVIRVKEFEPATSCVE